MTRSRKKADEIARGLLERHAQEGITDAEVTSVLDAWRFACNRKRQNVMAKGETFVHSDMLGLVCSRTGAVFVTKPTRMYANLVRILCRWLRDNGPTVGRPFCFSSICVNSGFASALHRDANNTSLSVTKAFGRFRGGSLLYWPDDDGAWPLQKLREADALKLDSSKGLVLFDGHRAHRVLPIQQGHRYSLVFYTMSAYWKASPAIIEYLRGLGVVYPTECSLAHFERLIAPPKGYLSSGRVQSIRTAFGHTEKACAVQWTVPNRTLLLLHADVIKATLSFVIAPLDMATLCGVCRRIAAAAWAPNAWDGSVVDASSVRPVGLKAHGLYTAWKSARLIRGGLWVLSNVGLLMSPIFCPWRWLEVDGRDFCEVGGKIVLVSQFPIPSNVTVGLGEVSRRVAVGISNTRVAQEVVAAFVTRATVQLRETSEVIINYACVMFSDGMAQFQWNGVEIGDRVRCNPSHRAVTFHCTRGCLILRIDGRQHATAHTESALIPDDTLFASVVMEAYEPVIPYWSRRDWT